MADASTQVTQLLADWSNGDLKARDRLLPLVYAELRRLAAASLRRERGDHTLQPTALVHELYLRLVEERSVDWRSRSQFFGVAAKLMRRILVDHARGRRAAKRGGGLHEVTLSRALIVSEERAPALVALDEALSRLASIDPQQARVVELRFFGGLSVEEASEVLGISTATVKREWNVARAWLAHRLNIRDS